MKPAYLLLIALGVIILVLVSYLAYNRSGEGHPMATSASQGVKDAYDTTKDVIKEDAAAIEKAAKNAKDKAADAVK